MKTRKKRNEAKEVLRDLNIKKYYEDQLGSVKWDGKGQGTALCPFHNDTNPSLSVNSIKGYFNCFGCKVGGNIFEFHMQKYKLGYKNALKALYSQAQEDAADKNTAKGPTIAATYDYHDEIGGLLFQVVRIEPKSFYCQSQSGMHTWVKNLDGVRMVPYNLRELIKSPQVFIVEGEKDVETLRGIGLVGSCNPLGAGKWKPEYNVHFKDKEVIIIPDNDAIGKEHAKTVLENLQGTAASVKIIELPDLNEKEDVTDWLNKGGTKEKLLELVQQKAAEKIVPLKNAISMQLMSLHDLFNQHNVTVEWQVEGLLPVGGFSILVSKPKVGKSTIARQLALNTAQGKPFLNRNVKQGAVIYYYSLEEKIEEVKRHFQDMGATGTEAVFISRMDSNAIERINQDVEEKQPVLIIIDHLLRLIDIEDVSDYVQITKALEPLMFLAREKNVHVLCLHHAKKNTFQDEDAVLGSTALFGSADTLIMMRESNKKRKIRTRQRYGKDLNETTLAFDERKRVMNLSASTEPPKEDNKDRIAQEMMGFIRSKGSVNEKTIMKNVYGNTKDKRRVLRELFKNNNIARKGRGIKGDCFVYNIPNSLQYTFYNMENEKTSKTTKKVLSLVLNGSGGL